MTVRIKSQHTRNSLVDITFTQSSGSDYACCVAYKSGVLYGMTSAKPGCGSNHKVSFIDNDYKNYDHEMHKRVVAQHQPKYATVVDMFTPEQAAEIGVKHYDFDSVMRLAEDLTNYAEYVIVIPKYDCIEDIPDKYVLGYSVPTSYGKTNLPIERFASRKVHLLGGSPRRQYLIWSMIPDSVISVDSNYLRVVSKYGRITNLHLLNKVLGTEFPSVEDIKIRKLGYESVSNPFYVSFAINIGFYYALFSKHPRDFDLSVEVADLKRKLNLES